MVDKAADGELRADARRNRDGLLTVAREVFAEQGTEASLRDVARRAGVGIGTLYRHFPTREALLEAVLRSGFEALRASADQLAAAEPPGRALVLWLREFTTRSGAYRGLPASVMAALHDEGSELYGACAAMHQAAARLLGAAQEAGAVRRDVDPEDLFTAAAAVGWAAERTDPDRASRILALISAGLAPGAAESA
ncbi:TetR/AcrR family transcriptional regulator [Streptomyces sp. NPDC021020]|uniref:TetR/AcrR family transcriptional regulator n=1 Tax=Streptomyces sp. NPDC021020 TaxID=3365109 RepID=UPI0037972C69